MNRDRGEMEEEGQREGQGERNERRAGKLLSGCKINEKKCN